MRGIVLLLVSLFCIGALGGCGSDAGGYYNAGYDERAAENYRARYESTFWNNHAETTRGGVNQQPLPLN